MSEYDDNKDIDMAEIYRQDYLDALDEIRNLRIELAEARKALNAKIEDYVMNLEINVKRD